MKILFTTPLTLYAYDLESGELDALAWGHGEYFGISWNQNQVFLSHSNIDNASLKTEADYRKANHGEICAYSREGVEKISGGISQPHQILVDSKNRLLAANTGLNRIECIDLVKKTSESINLSEITCDVIGNEKTGNHFNGMYEDKDSLFVVAHNNSRKSQVWELDKQTFAVQEIHDTSTEWAHNFWASEHGKIICDSKNGSLYEVGQGETLCKSEVPFITRGLAASEDYIYVGCSNFGDRHSRKFSDSEIWVLSRSSLETVDRIKMKRTGCITELRLIGAQDDCHNAPVISSDRLDCLLSQPTIGKISKQLSRMKYKLFTTLSVAL